MLQHGRGEAEELLEIGWANTSPPGRGFRYSSTSTVLLGRWQNSCQPLGRRSRAHLRTAAGQHAFASEAKRGPHPRAAWRRLTSGSRTSQLLEGVAPEQAGGGERGVTSWGPGAGG